MKKQIFLSILFLTVLVLVVYSLKGRDEKPPIEPEIANGELTAVEISETVSPIGPDLPEFVFDVGTRYKSIKKSDLNRATSFEDFIGREHAERIINYSSLSVIELEDGLKTDKKISSTTGILTPSQRAYLQGLNYSEDVLIWATYTEKWPDKGLVEDSYWTPHLTVVPEKQARYDSGKEALLDYLKVGSATFIANTLDGNIEPGRVHFTVSKEGTLTKIELKSTSGNEEIDQKIMELLSNAPGNWIPAENEEGENIDQELVIFLPVVIE